MRNAVLCPSSLLWWMRVSLCDLVPVSTPETNNVEKIRAALLHNKLLPIVSDLLNNDTVNADMLRLLFWSLSRFVQYGLFGFTILWPR